MRMTFVKLVMIFCVVAAVTSQQINGQSAQRTTIPAASLTFEVASVKPVPPPFPTAGGPWITSRGRFRAEAAQVRGVIATAYDVLPAQVKGGPDWLDRERYYFDARAENAEAGRDQIREMIRTLLADRLKLVIHRETQQVPVFVLTV